ncbi:MAG: hypothetical protein IPN88_15775 [Bacteroidetes bacterium]|nr:hypothetical protein [Bacteroidota bacterium]
MFACAVMIVLSPIEVLSPIKIWSVKPDQTSPRDRYKLLADIDATPPMNDRPPALDKAKESHLIQNKSPYEFDRIPKLPKETFVTIEIEYFLCGHRFVLIVNIAFPDFTICRIL